MNMKTYARIENGVVVELLTTDGDIAAMFHRDLVWVDCSGVIGVAYGWSYDGKHFAAPMPIDEDKPSGVLRPA